MLQTQFKETLFSQPPNVSFDGDITSLFIGHYDEMPDSLRSQWLDLRKEFMHTAMDWTVENDLDRYDLDENTKQFLLVSDGKILSGMRLTKVKSFVDSLSWSMLSNLDPTIAENFPNSVWDLTRLVPGHLKSPRESLCVFAEIFGAGFGHSLQQNFNTDQLWVFATRPIFIRAFQRFGIEFTEIEGCKRDTGVLCYADPMNRTRFLMDNKDKFPLAYETVLRGIQKGYHNITI